MGKTYADGRKKGSGRKAGSFSFCAISLDALKDRGLSEVVVSRVWALKNGLCDENVKPVEAPIEITEVKF